MFENVHSGEGLVSLSVIYFPSHLCVSHSFTVIIIKKAECWRIGAFEIGCWSRLLRIPWTARRSNKSILKEINPEYSLEGLMLKLKLPVHWPPDVKIWLISKDPDAEKDWRQEEKRMTEDEMVVIIISLLTHSLNSKSRPLVSRKLPKNSEKTGMSCMLHFSTIRNILRQMVGWSSRS